MTEGEQFFDRLDALSRALDELRQRVQLDLPADEVLEDLHISLEELRIADEELRAQNEELLAARESLLEQSRRYAELFNRAPDGYLVTDRDGVIEAANDMASVLLNVPAQYLAGKPLAAFIASSDLRDFWRYVSRVLKAAAGRVLSTEMAVQPRDGVPFPCAVRATAAGDAYDHVVGVRWSLCDIGQRVLMEEALRLSEKRYRTLLDGIHDYAIYMLDAQGNIASWNAGAQRLTGYVGHEIIGQPVTVLWPPEIRDGATDSLGLAAAQGRQEIEEWQVRRDGSRFMANVVLTALRDASGNLAGFSGVLRDVTTHRQADEKLRCLNKDLEARVELHAAHLKDVQKDLEDLSYSVSHDLRSPLRAIDGFAQMLLEDYADKVDAEGRRRLAVVKDNSRRMNRLIDGLLAFSRAGRREMRFVETDLTEVARQVVRESTRGLEGGLSVEVLDLPPACCDRSVIQEVLVQLVGNAIKFTRGCEKPTIEIGGRREDGVNVYWVKDNGVGFDAEYSGQLFGVFRRLHPESDFDGLGVGLAVVKRLVGRHGGRVWATGQVDEGATFWFALQCDQAVRERANGC
jgi:PAS domain S-box-containing protein